MIENKFCVKDQAPKKSKKEEFVPLRLPPYALKVREKKGKEGFSIRNSGNLLEN
jgi:hypothetical protein